VEVIRQDFNSSFECFGNNVFFQRWERVIAAEEIILELLRQLYLIYEDSISNWQATIKGIEVKPSLFFD
jgi:hypothetical protein